MDMIVIVDYGAGNVGNVARALRYLGLDWQIASTPANMPHDVELILLPGVGAFAPAAKKLEESGWRDSIIEWTRGGHPLLGICLGMQLLCECSFEDDPTPGLGLIKGKVSKLDIRPLPHMGWNDIRWLRPISPLQKAAPDGSAFYFVHSFALPVGEDAAAETSVQNVTFSSIVAKGNIIGFQFHPERSGPVGLRLLQRTIQLLERKGGA
jgi:glutamine amidotransferase